MCCFNDYLFVLCGLDGGRLSSCRMRFSAVRPRRVAWNWCESMKATSSDCSKLSRAAEHQSVQVSMGCWVVIHSLAGDYSRSQ